MCLLYRSFQQVVNGADGSFCECLIRLSRADSLTQSRLKNKWSRVIYNGFLKGQLGQLKLANKGALEQMKKLLLEESKLFFLATQMNGSDI